MRAASEATVTILDFLLQIGGQKKEVFFRTSKASRPSIKLLTPSTCLSLKDAQAIAFSFNNEMVMETAATV